MTSTPTTLLYKNSPMGVFTPENLETSLKCSTLIISFGKRQLVRWCLKIVSTKGNSTIATQTNLMVASQFTKQSCLTFPLTLIPFFPAKQAKVYLFLAANSLYPKTLESRRSRVRTQPLELLTHVATSQLAHPLGVGK